MSLDECVLPHVEIIEREPFSGSREWHTQNGLACVSRLAEPPSTLASLRDPSYKHEFNEHHHRLTITMNETSVDTDDLVGADARRCQ